MEIFILIFLTIFSSSNLKPIQEKKAMVVAMAETSVFEKYLTPSHFKPVKIYTDLINAKVEEVGSEEDGTLSVPLSWQNAGWYVNSAKPGEKGNIIIDGHYDTNTGSPAAFWNLKDLKVNDKVNLIDEVGKEYIYKVTSSYYVDIKDPNRSSKVSEVFGDSSVPTVTLITCGGIWLPGSSVYSKRLIVKGELIS